MREASKNWTVSSSRPKYTQAPSVNVKRKLLRAIPLAKILGLAGGVVLLKGDL